MTSWRTNVACNYEPRRTALTAATSTRTSTGETGDLVIEGQDLGPATAVVSPDGEYEWIRTVRRTDLPALVLALGGQSGEDILDILDARFTGQRSYDLERLLSDDAVPSELHVI